MKFLKVITCIVLVVSMLVMSVMPVSAARVTYYLSDLKLAEADTAEEAKKLLTDAGYTVLDKNLNPDGDKAVYLGYKKSTNVDDAITDIRVMNMNGGFNITDYETLKQDAAQEYKKTIDNYRIAAKEFAENYKAGKKEALLAYRQLNYYYIEKDGVKISMGDYMLNFPEKNDDFVDILFKGNPTILSNMRILLAMGVSDGGALFDRIKEAVNKEDVYTKAQYYESAKELVGKTQQLKQLLINAKNEIDEINADPDMTEEEKEVALVMPRYTYTLSLAFDEILKDIPMGESNYSEYFDKTTITDYSCVYPFVEAMTPGQLAMAVSGQLHAVLVYNIVEMSDAELEAKLSETEEDYKPLSVYFGTNMDIMEGSLGVTSEALREEAATGNSWSSSLVSAIAEEVTISLVIGLGGATLTYVCAGLLKDELAHVGGGSVDISGGSALDSSTLDSLIDPNLLPEDASPALVGKTKAELEATVNAPATASTATIVFSSIGLAAGIAIMAFSIYNIIRIINKYNTGYTDIPTNMVDTVETVNGNRYINYQVVNALYKDGDKTAEKAGDTNGYDGDQWNALYFTKSYEAGKCMTANGYFIDSESNFGKYTPVAKFGAKTCYDLNSFNDNENGEKIYIAFGNSKNKKTAETSVPTVIGSIFSNGGVIAISGVAGLGIGMGLMAIVKRKKKKPEETNEAV